MLVHMTVCFVVLGTQTWRQFVEAGAYIRSVRVQPGRYTDWHLLQSQSQRPGD